MDIKNILLLGYEIKVDPFKPIKNNIQIEGYA